MTALMFPSLPGQGWSVYKRPTFSTRVATHVSGREARLALYAAPVYEFEATFDALCSDGSAPGVGAGSLQSLLGLYLQCQGRHGTFLYVDPGDHDAVAEPVGAGDGETTSFVLTRAIGGYAEPVNWATSVSAVYLDGAAQPAGWTLEAPNRLVFTTPPAAGVAVCADFAFAYECRFSDDQAEFENFMAGLWRAQSVKFQSVKP
ncbi:DUF2460 domain-containing protein [Methylocella sp.]|uniref:DUF2460 domain-containing protein n=1 Tax=Methylocella sp. TaxID=1978226 RepID=UPI0037839F3A